MFAHGRFENRLEILAAFLNTKSVEQNLAVVHLVAQSQGLLASR
jgi:hypothetical protein